jgi:dienelactone hydrolase
MKRHAISIVLLCQLFCSTTNEIIAQGRNDGNKDLPVIFNSNETAKAGEAFGLQGYHFGDEPQLWYSVVAANATAVKPERLLKIVSHSDLNISAVVPNDSTIKEGSLLAVWVKNGSLLSRPVYLNRARAVTIEYDQVMPGQSFRIFGRNLQFPGSQPRVSLVEEKGNKSYPATVVQADAYVVRVQAPAAIKAGGRYKIVVSNGNGGSLSESIADEVITGVASAPDPFGLQVAWGTEFTFANNIYNVKTDPRLSLKAKGDSITDDRAAIQAAIDLAAANGGGVVYFPEGKYRLDIPAGSGLLMKSKVVLKGEGYEKSFIQYGFGTPPPYPDPIGKDGWPNATTEGVAVLWPLNTTLTGLYGLCLQNVNTSGIWRHSLKTMVPPVKMPGAGGSKFFAANCRFDFAVAWGLSWGYVDRFAITDCIFDSKAQVTWPWLWHCNGSTNFIVRNNRVHYAAGRFGFNDSYNGIIENNHITRLGDLQNPKGETGGFNIDYAQDIVVMANHLDVVGKDIENRNQGETILSQGGNPDQQATGIVTSATATSVTDAQQKWGLIKTPSLGSADAIAIIDGKGTGQWRRLVSNTANTVKIDRPWDVIPDQTSHYSIMRWSAEDWLVKGNVLEDNNRGIWFYCGATDLAIVGNKLKNSEGIYLRSDQRLTMGRYNLIWNALVENNQVINKRGLRPAFICNVLALGTKPDTLFGTGSIGVEIRRNYVEAHLPNVGTFVRGEGYFNEVLLKNPTYSTTALQGENTVGVMGTIFENNKVANADIGYRLSKRSSQTIIKDAVFRNVKATVSDSVKQDNLSEHTIWLSNAQPGVDPFIPYLTGKAPAVVKELGEETDSVKVRKLVFHSRDVAVNGSTVPTDVYAVIARPLQAGNYPGILVLHGGGGMAEIDRVRRWAAKGYIAVSLDLPGVADPKKVPNTSGNWKTFAYGEHRFTASPDLTYSTIFDGALAAVQALYLLRSQPDVIKERIGVTGVSWGGYMTTMVSGLAGSGIRASFSTYGAGFYDTASTFLPLLNKMPKAERETWLTYLDAGRRAKNIAAPFFIASPTNDNWFYPPSVMATLQAINSPDYHFFAPNANHAAPVPGGNATANRVGMMQMEEPWFNYYLKDIGSPLPEIAVEEGTGTLNQVNGTYRVRFFVESKTNITEATLYYSPQDTAWTKRRWVAVKAAPLLNGYYEAEVPATASGKGSWCFVSVSDDRPVTVSSHLMECK